MKPKEKIKVQREFLGLSQAQLADKIGLSSSEYWDIEAHEDESYSVVHLSKLKKLCRELKLDLMELFQISCEFCGQGNPYRPEYEFDRAALIHETRMKKGLSIEKLSELLGFEEGTVRQMETDPMFLEEWSLELIQNLASVLGLPFQILVGAKCRKCGK